MSGQSVYRWDSARAVADAGLRPRSVVVAESFVVDDGKALAAGVHRDRFLATAGPVAGATAEDFWDTGLEAVPISGSWFPRFELVVPHEEEDPVLRLWVRESPPRTVSARVVTAPDDPRSAPEVKGPDLEVLGRVRDEARARGSDEAVIVSGDGLVVEGAYSSLVWWRGDALCLVADDLPRLPGVTERSLVTLATALGVDVLREGVTPEELDGLEVWLLNSLHGARIVTSWADGPQLAEEPGRLRLWRSRLDALVRPVH